MLMFLLTYVVKELQRNDGQIRENKNYMILELELQISFIP